MGKANTRNCVRFMTSYRTGLIQAWTQAHTNNRHTHAAFISGMFCRLPDSLLKNKSNWKARSSNEFLCFFLFLANS